MGKHDESKKLPDTPWHIGYAKKEVDDPRRHKCRCIYLTAGICQCSRCETFLLKCPGSSHCRCYAETMFQDELNKEQSLSFEEESNKRAEKYRKAFQSKCKKMLFSDNGQFKNLNFNNMRNCPICNEKLISLSASKKDCHYCGAIFIKVETVEEIPKQHASFYILNKTAKSNVPKKTVILGKETCIWLKKKCTNPSSPFYGYQCPMCKFFQPYN